MLLATLDASEASDEVTDEASSEADERAEEMLSETDEAPELAAAPAPKIVVNPVVVAKVVSVALTVATRGDVEIGVLEADAVVVTVVAEAVFDAMLSVAEERTLSADAVIELETEDKTPREMFVS
ncbi:hypothetical protein W97_03978 [Coniosporium apollinis CBS 100218]|uniref:Uncharacterized protein n=1 Tax=Coniosporium apollinis (strain CBS 100218) TaxID=1168221 RepID=R7YS63_CONA1|nr:uncharacterized protein W97_03978 [Coniosporium apollinis CBS 100218]EON64745.1 hypothetical protein W97_03978 [Coniosporium apollinis CBS 100218]